MKSICTVFHYSVLLTSVRILHYSTTMIQIRHFCLKGGWYIPSIIHDLRRPCSISQIPKICRIWINVVNETVFPMRLLPSLSWLLPSNLIHYVDKDSLSLQLIYRIWLCPWWPLLLMPPNWEWLEALCLFVSIELLFKEKWKSHPWCLLSRRVIQYPMESENMCPSLGLSCKWLPSSNWAGGMRSRSFWSDRAGFMIRLLRKGYRNT